MSSIPRRWPPGVVGLLVWPVASLAIDGLLLRSVIDDAINAPISPLGLTWIAP